MTQKISQYRIPGFLVWALVLSVVLSAVHGRYLYQQASSFSLQVSMSSSVHGRTQFYYDKGEGLTERESVKTDVSGDSEFHTYNLPLPPVTIQGLRFDPLQTGGVVSIQEISFVNGFGKSVSSIDLHTLRPRNQIKTFDFKDNVLNVTIEEGATDPQIVIPLGSPLQLHEWILFPFASRLLGWFIVFFVSAFVLIWILRKQGVLTHFLDHPVNFIITRLRNTVQVIVLYLSLMAFLMLLLTNGLLSDFFAHNAFGTRIYANMWTHFLAGDFFVDFEYCTSECFVVAPGVFVSYFGFLPALWRGVASVFTDPYRLNLSNISMLAAFTLGFTAVARSFLKLGLLTGANRRLGFLFLAALFVGSPLLYPFAWGWIYHEAIAWGVMMALAFAATYVLWTFYANERTWQNGLFLGLTAGGAVMCRPTAGVLVAVPLTGLVALALWEYLRTQRREHLRPVIVCLATFTMLCAFTLTINHARWGNPLTFQDITRNIQPLTNPKRLANLLQHGIFDAERVMPSLLYYYLPTADNIDTGWPFIGTDRRLSRLPSYAGYDYVEAVRVPLVLNTTFFILLSALSLARWRRYTREVKLYMVFMLIGAVVMTAALMTVFCLAGRYSSDVALPWIFLALFWLAAIASSGETARLRWWHYALLSLNIYVMLTSVIAYKGFIWETPANFRDAIERTMTLPKKGGEFLFYVAGEKVGGFSVVRK